MDTNALKKLAQSARNLLISQITAKLAVVMDPASAARRENPTAIKMLEAAITQRGKCEIIEQVAYTWFNRFTAFRFMDVNGYTNPRVVSPEGNAMRPEILAEAMAGNLPDGAPTTITALLDGRTPSRDPQAEVYRLLLVYACNAWHGPMPFLFEKVGDYTELLMPEDLLSSTSILARIRDAMPEEDCKDVEIIGWLYQFYISEKKDQVFAGLKKNKKITAEDIPAATQLFTPHWIVRYLVENSLGRLWLLNRPASKLAERMNYYITPEETEADFLRIGKPEEIKVCDPACGSGHMLSYAFDLLYAIYEEEGFEADRIPALILQHNLTGVEIDDRAGALASFALVMKAAAKLGRRRFLRMEVKPNIVVLQNVTFTAAEMQDVAAVVGHDLFSVALRETLMQFEQAKHFGSLIIPKLRDPAEMLRVVEARDFGSDLLLKEVQARIVSVLRMAEVVSPKYHVVVANPPYMGKKGMNSTLQDFANKAYPDTKSDLFAMFMERAIGLNLRSGYMAMINMQSWMFLSSFEKLRKNCLSENTILSMAHLGERGFDSIGGSVVSTTAFVIKKSAHKTFLGTFLRLTGGESEKEKSNLALKGIREKTRGVYFTNSSREMEKIPGSPVSYWISKKIIEVIENPPSMSEIAEPRQGLFTTDNDRFLRFFWETSSNRTCFDAKTDEECVESGKRWFPHNKGGANRKWFGNIEYLVDWEGRGRRIKETAAEKYPYLKGNVGLVVHDDGYYFRPAISWSEIGNAAPAFRFYDYGFTFNIKGMSAFPSKREDFPTLLAFLNSPIVSALAPALNPTMSFGVNNFRSLPGVKSTNLSVTANAERLIDLARADWLAYETSWDFTMLPLLSSNHRAETLEGTYDRLRTHWQGMTDEMQRLEQENNRIFIDSYGLQNELTPEVPIEEITLTCNPAYRYGVKFTNEERETRLCTDTMVEFLSYAVGCMFGRYSLDAPGLILGSHGETLEDYLTRVPDTSYRPDQDNVVPVLDVDWFADDIVVRFRNFLRITFGEQHLRENLAFIEAQIGCVS